MILSFYHSKSSGKSLFPDTSVSWPVNWKWSYWYRCKKSSDTPG